MSLELLKADFPATVITVEQRLAYYESLDKAHCTGDYGDFIALVADSVEQSFKPSSKDAKTTKRVN